MLKRTSLAAAVAVTALVGGVFAAAPATARADQGHCGSCWAATSSPGEMVLTFNKKTWKALNAQMMVKATGKASAAGVSSFAFPATALDLDTITTKGGLAFVRADASLKVKTMVLDLSNESVTAKIPGIGTDYELFDLGNLSNGKKVKAKVNVALGQADMLNEALKTDIFSDGMTLGRIVVSG